MYRCDILESEKNTRNMFFNVLNPDLHAMFKYIPRSIIGTYVGACAFEKHIQEKALNHSDPFNSCTPATVVSSNVPRMNIVVRFARLQTWATSTSTVPSPPEPGIQGNSKGTDSVNPHENDECVVDSNMSCGKIENDLVTPHVLEECTSGLNVLCDQSNEIDAGLSAYFC
jgi:hypothetical protein